MRFWAQFLCISAWLLGFIAQAILVYRAPNSLVAFGVEMAEPNKIVNEHALIFIGIGLLLAIAACFARSKWGAFLTGLSAAMYLLRWFPFKAVFTVGPVAVARGIYLISSNPNVGWSVTISNFVLPSVFIVVILLIFVEARRSDLPTPACKSE